MWSRLNNVYAVYLVVIHTCTYVPFEGNTTTNTTNTTMINFHLPKSYLILIYQFEISTNNKSKKINKKIQLSIYNNSKYTAHERIHTCIFLFFYFTYSTCISSYSSSTRPVYSSCRHSTVQHHLPNHHPHPPHFFLTLYHAWWPSLSHQLDMYITSTRK